MIINNIENSTPKINNGYNIGIFGGSFDPPHISHTLMAISMLALEPIDELWIIPCADHPLNKDLSSFSHRFKMCKYAFSRFSKQVKVVPIEQYLPSPSYTVQTLKTIKEIRPNIKLSLAIGSDLLEQIPKWHKFECLEKLCNLIIFLRVGFPIKKLHKKIKINKIYKNYFLPNISSNIIRKKIKELHINKTSNRNLFIDLKILKFINNNELYI